MKKIIVLGAGRVGSAIAFDLADQFEVTVCDRSIGSLQKINNINPSIKCIHSDFGDCATLETVLNPFDLVVSAVPGCIGFRVLEMIIRSEKQVVDISFFPEEAFQLDALAKSKKVTAIVDCGVAPGMDNIILGYYQTKMRVDQFMCMVGGLPKIRKAPFEYKAPFSPSDVIEEYLRPARYKVNGKMISADPLAYCEQVSFEKPGILEAIYTDGLRSLLFTMPQIPDMKEMTLRYPGHTGKIKVLKDAGFFSEIPVAVKGKQMIPKEMTASMLYEEWKLSEGEVEFTVMKVEVSGKEQDGSRRIITYDLYDEYDPSTKTSSMARTTGYTATAAVNLLAKGMYTKAGIIPPEFLGADERCFRYILDYLQERNVVYSVKMK